MRTTPSATSLSKVTGFESRCGLWVNVPMQPLPQHSPPIFVLSSQHHTNGIIFHPRHILLPVMTLLHPPSPPNKRVFFPISIPLFISLSNLHIPNFIILLTSHQPILLTYLQPTPTHPPYLSPTHTNPSSLPLSNPHQPILLTSLQPTPTHPPYLSPTHTNPSSLPLSNPHQPTLLTSLQPTPTHSFQFFLTHTNPLQTFQTPSNATEPEYDFVRRVTDQDSYEKETVIFECALNYAGAPVKWLKNGKVGGGSGKMGRGGVERGERRWNEKVGRKG